MGVSGGSAEEESESDSECSSGISDGSGESGEGERFLLREETTLMTSSVSWSSKSSSSSVSLIATAESWKGDSRVCLLHLRMALPLELKLMPQLPSPSSELGAVRVDFFVLGMLGTWMRRLVIGVMLRNACS